MSRILIVVPPLVGHVNPTIPLGYELSARGHEVIWAGLLGVVDPMLPAGAPFVPVSGGLDAVTHAALQVRARGLRGAEALKFLWEDFLIPLARAMVPEIEAAIDAEQPDLLVVDQQAVGAAAVARRRGLPWVTSATTSAELTNPLAALPRVDEWVRDELHAIQIDAGIDASDGANGDLRFSDDLVLAFTTEALAGAPKVPGIAPRVRFVGPCLESRPETAPFDWEWLDPARPLVLVSLGTVNAEVGDRFFGVVVEALADAAVQAILVAPPDRVDLGGATNILVADRVPQLALLARSAAVLTHGGHNTVCEALAQSLPLVLAPIRDDQPIVASQVVRAGAGVRVKFARVKPPELRAAVEEVLSDPAPRDAAARIARSFAEAGGTPAAADAVVACLRERVR